MQDYRDDYLLASSTLFATLIRLDLIQSWLESAGGSDDILKHRLEMALEMTKLAKKAIKDLEGDPKEGLN